MEHVGRFLWSVLAFLIGPICYCAGWARSWAWRLAAGTAASAIVSAMLVADARTCFAWAPLVFALAHISEEFVFPGGFMPWYRRYRGSEAKGVTPRFLVVVNVVLLAVCCNAGLAAQRSEAFPYWLGIAALLCSNGVWHIWAAMRSRSYSPGMITGAVLYLPLAIYGLVSLIGSGAVSIPIAALAVGVGGSYPIWSAVFHRRSKA